MSAPYIEQIGSGEPLVILHGWGMHSGIWQSVREALAAQHRLYLVDLPGMGFSQGVLADQLAQVASDMRAELHQLIHQPYSLMGWSLGGLIAMQMALQDIDNDMPTAINKLILVATTPCFVDRNDWQHGVASPIFHGFFEEVIKDFANALEKFLALIAMGSGHTHQEVKMLLQVMLQRPHPSLQSLQAGLNILLASDLRGQLQYIRQPVLWIHGERDRLCPVSAAQWSSQQLAQVQLEIFASAGHEPFISHPQQFIHSVNQFLGQAQ